MTTSTPLTALPREDRPRERLLRAGGAALTDVELVAVLLRTGRRGCSALSLARALLDDLGGLMALATAEETRLRRAGMGDAKCATLMAAGEIGRRLARARVPMRRPVDQPDAVARYLLLRYGRLDQEVMGALFVDVRNRLLGESELFRGTLHRAAVEPRAVLKEALARNASGVVLFHNHPSGDPTPSHEDLAFTQRMATAGEVVGVRLVDHLILGDAGRWVSLRRLGAW
ncbi:MAG: DNA repair protein RadC [Acidobacteriota bacterium]